MILSRIYLTEISEFLKTDDLSISHRKLFIMDHSRIFCKFPDSWIACNDSIWNNDEKNRIFQCTHSVHYMQRHLMAEVENSMETEHNHADRHKLRGTKTPNCTKTQDLKWHQTRHQTRLQPNSYTIWNEIYLIHSSKDRLDEMTIFL